MPEGDTVYRQCSALHAALAGLTLTRAEIRVPRHATADLAGWCVEEVQPRGKHLLFRLRGAKAEQVRRLTLHCHLMMDGTFSIATAGRLVDVRDVDREDARGKKPFQARIVLEALNEQGLPVRVVGYDVHQVRLVPSADEATLIGHLGPDLLDPNWGRGHEKEAIDRLLERPERSLGVALLDQRIMAGIGNVFRSELCFVLRCDPRAPISAVEDPARLVDLARRFLHVNKDRSRRITTGGSMGRRADLWVYGRAGKPCWRCGTRISREYLADPERPELQERSIYICSSCQPQYVAPQA